MSHPPADTSKSSVLHVPPPDRLAALKITVAPNGARRMPSDHPALPITVSRIADTAAKCWAAGADEIHLHVRDAQGAHSLNPDLYREAIAAIEESAPGMQVQITTESAGVFDVAAQFATLRMLEPAAASVSVREIQRSPELARPFYACAAEAGTRVQHILYDHGDLETLLRLLDEGTVPDQMRDVILVFGKYSPPTPARPEELAPFVAAMGGAFADWTICAFGSHEQAVAEEAMRLGGHIRIGFENNIQRPDGALAADNAENIARAVAAARAMGRPLLSQERQP